MAGARGGGPQGMRGEIQPKSAGRLAAYLFVASGVLSAVVLLLPQLPDVNRGAVLVVSAFAVLVGCAAYLLPWQRFDRKATLALLPIAFAVIALGNHYGSARSASYSVFFIVAFVWIGIGHPRWTSPWFAPIAAIAYMAPIILRGGDGIADASDAALTIPVCVLVAEILAWIVESQQSSRNVAQALARSASRLSHHLNEAALCQSLVEEARGALGAEHATLYRLDDTMIVRAVFMSRTGGDVADAVRSLVGIKAEWLPHALTEGEAVIVDDTSKTPNHAEFRRRFGIKSYIAIPVMARGSLVGVLACDETEHRRSYDSELLSIANGLAGQASAAFQNARLYEQTLAASRCDPLTGLGNRRAFRDRLASEFERARRYGRELSLILLDVDRLKTVNDTFGHRAGDRSLVRLGEMLQQSRRKEDGAFRIGGDEFALVLPETGHRGAALTAERLRRRISHAALGGDRNVPFTVSVGVSSFCPNEIDVDELFERADAALYEVKALRGNAIAVSPSARNASRLGVDIERVIAGAHLVPYYQPIFDMTTERVLGFEGFSRLDPVMGYTPTPTLFKAASAVNKLETLDRLCCRVVLDGSAGLDPEIMLFVNALPATLESETFDPAELINYVEQAGLSLERVVVEITEYERTPRSKQFVANLRECREAGLRVALDDFGAGGADLDLLAGCTFDFVKVDMAFVQGANGIETRRRVLRGLKMLAVETDALTIAEGIETSDDLRLVRDLGFMGAQGFLLREPSLGFDLSPLSVGRAEERDAVPAGRI